MSNNLKEELRDRIIKEYAAGSRIIDVLLKLSEEYELDEYDIKKVINDDINEIIFKQEMKLKNLKEDI